MTTLACPRCEGEQDVSVTVDTHAVQYVYCSHEFKIPREHRRNKRELKEYASRVNIRVGYRTQGNELDVAWTVQSAEKGNQYLERKAVSVEISGHPVKTQ